MIQTLANKYKKHISWPFFIIFYLQFLAPLYAAAKGNYADRRLYASTANNNNTLGSLRENDYRSGKSTQSGKDSLSSFSATANNKHIITTQPQEQMNIGGPSSPEASSFKAVGSNNLVNLFTGDFSYSIPLLDVGGYPVNMFYSGGVGMEQEASWVGLGWNINPGTVNRNMRGVPDDFDGTDLLKVNQNVRPNRTFGAEVGIDAELFGIKNPKLSLGLNTGFSYNNYLGPEFTTGVKLSLALAAMQNVGGEKQAPIADSIQAAVGAKLSSRSGLTISPSLSASATLTGSKLTQGIGLSTSYNSRIGLQELSISGSLTNAISKAVFLGDAMHLGTTISFAKPSYIPTLRMPMANLNISSQMEFGLGAYGFRGSLSAMGYYAQSVVPEESQIVTKPLVGYMYSEKAMFNENAVMDFNRLGDAEVTPNTPIISAPQYNYDIFSIQGEGTGGTIRAYRGDLGFMRDNVTTSKDLNVGIGVDIGPPAHYGGNYNIMSTPTRVGGWNDHNNTLLKTMSFKPKQVNSSFENIYFRNPGEATVTNEDVIKRIGYDNLVQFQLDGPNNNTSLQSNLQLFNKKTISDKGVISVAANTDLTNREKRTQVTTMITAGDAAKIGLERTIRNYTGAFAGDTIVFENILRDTGMRKQNHISEINVLEQNGMRYVYGIPVYSKMQKDFTFTVKGEPDTNNLVKYTDKEPTIKSDQLATFAKMHGYVQSQETPSYAASFLLTGLLSPDYVDVTGNGITEDDLGSAVKFDYSRSTDPHRWRTPRSNLAALQKVASFNEGIRTEKKDNKAMISYGEREVWYLKAIESKSMVAIFKTDARNDAKGVNGEMDGGINTTENANKKLSRIDLYTKAEIKAKGIDDARPLKSVFFVYDYSLCKGTPDNNGLGKLTLKEVYFSYNGQIKSKDRYVFGYGDSSLQKDNPSYTYSASDRWGTYKPRIINPSQLSNADYPFTADTSKTLNDQFAGAWSLKKILLPSGGQMEMKYESDDYAYTQDRRACNMFGIYGFGNTTSSVNDNSLYRGLTGDNNYVYIKLPVALQNTDSASQRKEIYDKYLEGIKQLAFKLQVNMPNGPEPLTCYASFDDYGLCANNTATKDYIYLHLIDVNGKSPLANSSIGFLTGNIPGQAFPGYDVDITSLGDFIGGMIEMMSQLATPFANVDEQMRMNNRGKTVVLNKSFIRLDNPSKMKYGGGARVKQVLVRDNWDKMKGQFVSVYGQDYDYTTTEKINGKDAIISSGVASYEPGIGGEENPFREILQFDNKLPLASAQYGAVEMPILEGLYPSPLVGYGKVTVRSIHRKGTHGDSSLRSAIGKQVTEFYTAREFPSYSTQTTMDSREYKKNPFFSFFYKEVKNYRTITQGFLVETNDMHGKMKSQSAFSESDEKTPLSATYHTYKNTGKNGLNDKVDFVFNNEGGAIHQGNMGIDMELMTDEREFSVKSRGVNGQIQADLLFFTFLIVPIPTFLPLVSFGENRYRAVTCTKLINYHAIEDSVVVMDKGSVISTKTIAYDAETGSPIVTKTANEFNDPIYNVSYPAYWAYSGTGLAYKNIDRVYTGVDFYDGKMQGSAINQDEDFEGGDELYLIQPGTDSSGCIAPSNNVFKLWALDTNKNNTALIVPEKYFVFIDSIGRPFTKNGVSFRIIRSGKRNNLGLTVSAATCMKNPIQAGKLLINSAVNVTAASAMEYKEKWQVDNDAILRKTYYTPECTSLELDSVDCDGVLEKRINPYLKGLVGNLKPYRSYTYYGSRNDSDINISPAIRKNGYFSNFGNYWDFNTATNLVPDTANTKWVWNSEVTRVNAKGQELETRDALNRYNSVQYGFNKNMPTAVVNNAGYGEIFHEGFEDNDFADNLNVISNSHCANNKYIDLSPNPGLGKIVNIDSTHFAAHTGNYMLQIDENKMFTKSFSLIPPADQNYHVLFGKDTTGSLNDPGGNYNFGPDSGSPLYHQNPTISFAQDASVYITMDFKVPDNGMYSAGTSFNFYINITTAKWYKFQLGLTRDNPINTTCTGYSNGISAAVTDVRNNSVGSLSFSQDKFASDGTSYKFDSIYLCPGGYKIDGSASTYYQNSTSYRTDSYNSYRLECQNCNSVDYASLSKAIDCISTTPIAATESMLNPIFSLTPDKRMQFSAWVKEDCEIPCNKTDYDKSNIEIWSGGVNIADTTVKRTGGIIEGWQKIEGAFTLPSDATQAEIRFINTNSAPMYVDDIRIHPFNANMKSYVYDPHSLRLSAELDENNYASFYEYDEEGQLVRVKKETIAGIKTIKETRNAKQKAITEIQ